MAQASVDKNNSEINNISQDNQTNAHNDISRVQLTNGEIYNFKDLEVRKGLEALLGKNYHN